MLFPLLLTSVFILLTVLAILGYHKLSQKCGATGAQRLALILSWLGMGLIVGVTWLNYGYGSSPLHDSLQMGGVLLLLGGAVLNLRSINRRQPPS